MDISSTDYILVQKLKKEITNNLSEVLQKIQSLENEVSQLKKNNLQTDKFQCISITNTLITKIDINNTLNKSFSYKLTIKNRLPNTYNQNEYWLNNYIFNNDDFNEYFTKLILNTVHVIIYRYKLIKEFISFPLKLTYHIEYKIIELEIYSNEIILNRERTLDGNMQLLEYLLDCIKSDNTRNITKLLSL